MKKVVSKIPLKCLPVDRVVRISAFSEPMRIIHQFTRFTLMVAHLDGSIITPIMLPSNLEVVPIDDFMLPDSMIFGFYSGDL